jgi:pimeloyl-ACP methyl ester carboxylesterase
MWAGPQPHVAPRTGDFGYNWSMTSVVLIHGAYNELWGPHELAARWIPALQDGLWHVGSTIDPSDISVCFYGDLFRHDPEAVDSGHWTSTRAGVEDALVETVGHDTLDTLTQLAGRQTYERTVDMLASMAVDPALADRVRQRLVDLLDDTRILVSHSLGTVIAHQVLVAHPEIAVGTLLTLGSPLGSPPFTTDGEWPGRTERWVNVVALTDPVAQPGRVPDRFGSRVEERLIDNGHRGHHPEPYLNSRAVGDVVAAALAT